MKEINGFILSDDLTVISDYKGSQKKVTLPKGVKTIMDYALMDKGFTSITLNEELEEIGNRSLQGNNFKEIIIPKSVNQLGFCAFNCCYELKKVTILNPKISMYTDSFDHCYEIEDIYFNGTLDEWYDTIYDYEDGGIFLPSEATIHFADGTTRKW